MYTHLQPLSATQQGELRLVDGHYAFAAEENFAPIFLQELGQVAREYVICFPNNQTDLPHVLLGFRDRHNAYVAEDGQWRGLYVPAALRRYPFALAKVQGGQQGSEEFTLTIDTDAPNLSTTEGSPLFEGNQLAQPVQQRVQLLKGIEAQKPQTQTAVKLIDELGLFKMEQLTIKRGDQMVANIGGLRMIDDVVLNTLSGDTFAKLHETGALELIYAHRLSRANLRLGILNGQLPARAKPLPGAANKSTPENLDEVFGEDDEELEFDFDL